MFEFGGWSRSSEAGFERIGAFVIDCNIHFQTAHESLGASNKYTPDVLYWNAVRLSYAMIGGKTDSGLSCGSSCFTLYNIAADRVWGIGASTAPQYIPDDLWWGVGNRYYTLVGDLTNSGLRCGSSSSDLLHPAGYMHSGFGASFYMQYT